MPRMPRDLARVQDLACGPSVYTGKVQGQVVAWNSRDRTEKKRSGNDEDRNGEEKGDG